MNEVVPEPKGNWGKTTCSLLIAPVALLYPQIAENSTTAIECKAGLFYLTYAPVLMNQVHSLLLWCINNNRSHSRCLLKRNEALNFCRRTFATPWGTTWTAVAAQSPDGAATGEVCWALMYLRSARSLSLSGIKKTNSQATVAWRYSRSKKIHSATHNLKTCIRTWRFSEQQSRRQTWNCGSWDTCTQRKIYSWACATTTSHTLSGTTSHRANCNWAVNLLSNHRAWNPVTSPGFVRIQGLAWWIMSATSIDPQVGRPMYLACRELAS